MYGLHPSNELVELFRAKPYQGQKPEDAQLLFFGRDANYSNEISRHQFFSRIVEYQEDGVLFWQRHGVHHPFLHREYPFDKRRDGVRYHANFAKLGLESEFATAISFVELLDVPTIGMTTTSPEHVFNSLLNPSHLARLERLFTCGREKQIFLPRSVFQDIQKLSKRSGYFRSTGLDRLRLEGHAPSATRPILSLENADIYMIYHFSSCQIHQHLPDLADTVRRRVTPA